MKKTVSALAMLCMILMTFGWWGISSNSSLAQNSQFIDLEGDDAENYYSDPLQDFEGTVVFAFHEAQAGMEEDNLKEYLVEKHIESSKVVKIDVNSQRSLAERYQIRTTPTLFVMQDGQIVSRDCQTKSPSYSNVSHRPQARSNTTQALHKPSPYGMTVRGNRRMDYPRR